MEQEHKVICNIDGLFENGYLNIDFINLNYRSFNGWKCMVAIPMVDDWDEKEDNLICVNEDNFNFISGFHYRTETPDDHIQLEQFSVDGIPEGEWVWRRMKTKGDWKLIQWKLPKTEIRLYLKRQYIVPLLIAEDEREAEYLKEWCIIE